MKSNLLSLVFIAAGSMYFFITFNPNISGINLSVNFDYKYIETVHSNYEFITILVNNLIVAFMVSIIGFITGGIMTSVVLFWNGYLLAIIYKAAFLCNIDVYSILYNSKHVPIELYSFVLFSKLGLKGFRFMKNILVNRIIKANLIPSLNKFILPTILLILAAIIESI